MQKESPPFGEQFTCPSRATGAVATKNTRCVRIQSASSAVMCSKSLPKVVLGTL
jgi:hypothetical protein